MKRLLHWLLDPPGRTVDRGDLIVFGVTAVALAVYLLGVWLGVWVE